MRKAIIAAIVASALFAVGAFAASFSVSAEDVASGADSVDACATYVNIDFADPAVAADGQWTVNAATVQFLDESRVPTNSCEGARIQLALVLEGNDGAKYGSPHTLGAADSHTFDFDPVLVQDIISASVVADGTGLTPVVTNVE